MLGFVNATGGVTGRRPTSALANDIQLSGRSGQSAMLSYAETNSSVSYWLSTGAGIR